MKVKSILSVLMAALMVLGLCVAAPTTAMAAPAEVSAKIGEITSITGQVLIRNKGEWQRLTDVPVPVFSTDKVVTKQGRAEIELVDGGVVRMDVDSSLSIVRLDKKEGVVLKKTVQMNQINVIVGDVYFEVKVKKNENARYSFKTPTMTAAIRGSALSLNTTEKETKYAKLAGTIDTAGKFTTNPNPNIMTTTDVKNPQAAQQVSERAGTESIKVIEQIMLQKEVALKIADPVQKAVEVAKTEKLNIAEMKSEAKSMKDDNAMKAADNAEKKVDASIKAIEQIQVQIKTMKESAEKVAEQTKQVAAKTDDAGKKEAVNKIGTQTAEALQKASDMLVRSAVSELAKVEANKGLGMTAIKSMAMEKSEASKSLSDAVKSVEQTEKTVDKSKSAVQAVVTVSQQTANAVEQAIIKSPVLDAAKMEAVAVQAQKVEAAATIVENQVQVNTNLASAQSTVLVQQTSGDTQAAQSAVATVAEVQQQVQQIEQTSTIDSGTTAQIIATITTTDLNTLTTQVTTTDAIATTSDQSLGDMNEATQSTSMATSTITQTSGSLGQ